MKPNENEVLTDLEKAQMKVKLEVIFKSMLEAMRFDLNDPQIKDTPRRMAKMYVHELLNGCYSPSPKLTTFPSTGETSHGFVFLGPIKVKSLCSHHFLPFTGSAYIAYIPETEETQVVGISKIARVVQWFMRRPQIQEQLTAQVAHYLAKYLKVKNVIVHMEATHMCMTIRGAEESFSTTMATTAKTGETFSEGEIRKNFFDQVSRSKE